ncbi:MAG: translation initiation factor IF-2 [Candidatus Omnitrophica bacterium]|nr:translation initiation factor IF-2 [Candidatus Omnitrophota bacterium]
MIKPKKEKTVVKKKATRETAPKKESRAKVSKPAHKPARPKAAVKAVVKKTAPKEHKPLKTVKAAPSFLEPEVKKPKATHAHRPAAASPAKPAVHQAHKPQAPIFPKPQIIPQKITPAPQIKEAIKPAKEVKKEAPEEKVAPAPAIVRPELKEIELRLPITVKDLSVRLQQKSSALIKVLMEMRVMATLNQALDEQIVAAVCEKFGFRITKAPEEEELALSVHTQADPAESLKPRFPIVTFMGHVDHGKTSLLDAIRKTKVAELEHGGITQHIGAYRVVLPHGEITFLDTPGHEAFTAMRARGAGVTDIVVLVVAADDGVMPQTEEAIDHARAAGVPIIVAINKIDKPQADVDRVKKKLGEFGLLAEDWGGKTIAVGVSAKTGQGIDDLLEMILLEAQMLELKANPKRLAKGVVLEAKITQGRGPVATLLVQNGTLRLNDNIVVGNHYGKIRAMFNDRGSAVAEALPSFPVEILGISGVPQAGEQFFVIEDEKIAKDLVLKRKEKEKLQQVRTVKRINLEDLHAQIKEGKIKELKIIIKSDVQGSLGAIKDTLAKINTQEIKLEIIHEGVGAINSSDVVLAAASNALILGFHVEADDRAKELISKEGIDVRMYNVIYELANDIKAALEGMLEPKLKKVFLGRAEVKKVFKLSRSGTIAGCMVIKGKINRNVSVSLVRNGEVVFEGKISSLKRFKDDIREAAEGFECGISLGGFDGLMEGDIIEAYEIEKIARTL